MKVILTTSIERGGPIEQSLILAKSLQRQGIEVGAVCGSPAVADRFNRAGARAWVIPLRRTFDPLHAARLYRVCSGWDVVHAHDRRAGLWLRLGPRPRRSGVRIYTAHGVPDPYLPPPVGTDSPSLRDRLAYPVLDAALCRRADVVVVPSHSVATDLSSRLNFPRDRIAVIPNGVQVEEFDALDGDRALIGTLSRFDAFKALDVFVDAAAVLIRDRPDLRFAMFGTGPDEARIRRRVDEHDLASVIQMPGYVAARDALAKLRVYVLPSYWENAPIALLEAMASGVPVVATRVHGIPEIVDEGSAQLVDPGDPAGLAEAILRLVDDPELAQRQASAARRRVAERFSSHVNGKAMADLYALALRQRRNRLR
jgi:glycosyltransferase involved in cell wall biosynthesis